MHSCHTALSNYSTIAGAQVMEFQLKYDSFRICFCRWRKARVVVVVEGRGRGISWSWRGGNGP